MGLFDKLKEILFDEETVEIPVITKEETEKKKTQKKVNTDDEVIVHKLESTQDEELFDMPKLKEEAEEEVRTSTFTFPVFDDEEVDLKETSRTSKKVSEEPKEEPYKKSTTRKYDFLSSTDYRAKKETTSNRSTNRYDSVSIKQEEKKPFTLSPIISPVYGILNENYKKEDIVTRSESVSRLSAEKVDLDSVRKKAYGTLEDEIEVSLSKTTPASDVLDEVPSKEELTLEDLSDDGISINDLLVDTEDKQDNFEDEIFAIDEMKDTMEEIELDDEDDSSSEEKNKEALGEEDLFDLIDSLYAGKGEN